MGHWRLVVVVWTGVIAVMTLTQAAWSEAIGQIKTLAGEVAIVREHVKMPAKAGDLLEKADTLITGSDGRVGITFIDNSRFSLGPNSQIALEKFTFNPTTQEVVSCSLWVAVVVMGFLLQGNRVTLLAKKRTNSGPFMESTGKHSIYT
jgi:hypothetical protein